MSLPEQASKVATGTVEALAGTPTLLVMVILNIGLIGVAGWYLNQRDISNAQIVTSVIERCWPVAQINPRLGGGK